MKHLCSALMLALALHASPASAADFPEGARNRLQLELGGAWDSFDTEARLDLTRDGLASVGTTVDFERLLNIPVMEKHFRGVGQWRFSNVSYVQVAFESIERAGRRTLDGEISWGDLTYTAGGQVDGRFDSSEIYVGYRFDMFRADNVRVGGTFGFSYWDLQATLTGHGKITKPDGSTEEGSFERGFDIAAPVPVLGLVVDGAISKDFTFGFYVRALAVNLEEAAGGTLAGGLSTKWYFTKNLGLGAGLDVTSIRVREYTKGNQAFSASYTFVGPRLFLAASF